MTPGDLLEFPSFLKRLASGGGTPNYRRPCCVGPIAVKSMQPLADDIAHVKAAAAKHGATEVFMNAAFKTSTCCSTRQIRRLVQVLVHHVTTQTQVR